MARTKTGTGGLVENGISKWGIAPLYWALAATVVVTGLAWAESSRGPQYFDRHRCGVVDAYRLAPRTALDVDLDGDGVPEHYVANAGGVERFRAQGGTTPPVMVRDTAVYRAQGTSQYSCVDLRAYDGDGDGDLDLFFGTPSELVVLENTRGRFRVLRREPQSWPAQADVRFHIGPSGPRLRPH